MKQVLIIHGGESYSSHNTYLNHLKTSDIDYERLKPQRKWKSWIAEQLPDTDVLLPTFPNGHNASYNEWRIYFEKLIPFFGNNIQLVGHSLGAMFLAKYLQEQPLTQPVRRLILIAGSYNDRLPDESSDFLISSATDLGKSAEEVHLFHSKDDPVVPFAELGKFQSDLPGAISHTFEDHGHFNGETFPALLEILKQK